MTYNVFSWTLNPTQSINLKMNFLNFHTSEARLCILLKRVQFMLNKIVIDVLKNDIRFC